MTSSCYCETVLPDRELGSRCWEYLLKIGDKLSDCHFSLRLKSLKQIGALEWLAIVPDRPAPHGAAGELTHFVECIRKGKIPSFDGRAGRHAVEIVSAIATVQRKKRSNLPCRCPLREWYVFSYPAHYPDFWIWLALKRCKESGPSTRSNWLYKLPGRDAD